MAFILTLGSFLTNITTDNSNDSYLADDAPASIVYETFRQQFGQDEMLLIAIEPPNVFTFEFLEQLKSFHEALENEIPYVAEVTSLINARQMHGEGDLLIVEDLLEEWPQNEEELNALKQKVMTNRLYLNQYISSDGRYTTVLVRPDIYPEQDETDGTLHALDGFDDQTDSESLSGAKKIFFPPEKKQEIVDALDKVVRQFNSEQFKIDVAGGFYFTCRITAMMKKDVAAYLMVCSALIFGLLLVLFRRLAGILLPALVVVSTLVATFGAMGLFGIPFSISLQMAPVFLLCICVCNCVHILVPFYQSLAEGHSKAEAISDAFRFSGLAILMANLTTAAGMGSFMAAELQPVRYLGLVSSMGVMMAYVLSLLLMTALLAIFPSKPPGSFSLNTTGVMSRCLVAAGELATGKPWWILIGVLLICVWSVLGISHLGFSHQPISWFPKDHEVRLSSELIDRHLGGSRSIEILVDTGRENGLHDPDVLAKMERAIDYATSLQEENLKVGKEVSFLDILQETNQALHQNDENYYSIPDNEALIAQELLLFENSGSDDLETLVDSQFSMARISLRIPRADRSLYQPFLEKLNSELSTLFAQVAEVNITGIAPLLGQIFFAMVQSMAKSYLVAFLVIVPLMILLIGSLRMGFISMIPNFFPIIVVLGVMGWLGIPLDTGTILIGSILIGLAVDDTIHIFHHFKRHYDHSGTVSESVTRTLRTTGVALLFTSVVLGIGFLSIGANATMTNSIHFGYITALGIALAFIADIIVSPALMAVVYRKKHTSNIHALEG